MTDSNNKLALFNVLRGSALERSTGSTPSSFLASEPLSMSDLSPQEPSPHGSLLNEVSSSLVLPIRNNLSNHEGIERKKIVKIEALLGSCGKFYSKWRGGQCLDCGHVIRYRSLCKLRLCSKCAVSRQNAVLKVLNGFYKRYLSRRNCKEVIHLTLTTRGHKQLNRETKKKLISSFYAFRRRFARRKLKPKEKPIVLSGVYIVENKLESDGLYHYHMHVLLLNPFIDIEEIRKEWFAVSSAYYVYMKRINAYVGFRYLSRRATSPLKAYNLPLNSQISLYLKHVKNSRYLSFFGYAYSKGLRDLAKEVENCGRVCRVCGGSNLLFYGVDVMSLMYPEEFVAWEEKSPSGSLRSILNTA